MAKEKALLNNRNIASAVASLGGKVKFIERQLHIEQLRFKDEHNARPADTVEEHQEAEDAMLVATIEAVGGVVLPLIVVDLHKQEKGRDLYAVAAGGRRLRALQFLRKENRLENLMIACREVESFDPLLISLIENMARQRMHPADECVAFGKLVAKGQGAESIAAAFGTDVKHVHRCLALAKLHPQLLNEFRKRTFGMDVAKALTCEPDTTKQLAAWKKLSAYHRDNAHCVRQALIAQDLRSGDRLVRFVGLEAYREAGGELREDLFATDAIDAMILVDPGLVESLARAKLEDKVAALLGQGWAWAEALEQVHNYDVRREAASRGFLRVEVRGTERSTSGYFVYCDQSGNLQIDGPYMAKKEAKALERKKAGVSDSEGVAAEPRISESLMTSLTAHKTAALQCALLKTPRVALALLAANAVSQFYGQGRLRVRFDSQRDRLESLARGFEQTKAAPALSEVDRVWEARIPEDADAFAWFLEQPEAVSIEAVVWATARAFNVIGGRTAAEDVADLEKALSFNLADYFKPTVENYLGQVSKAQIVGDVTEALGAEAAAPLEGMKKGEMAAAAEAKLAEVAWVPQAIR
jgi:ParB family chromosome partitioning protein